MDVEHERSVPVRIGRLERGNVSHGAFHVRDENLTMGRGKVLRMSSRWP